MAENWKRALEFLKATALTMHFVERYHTLVDAEAQRSATPDLEWDLAEVCARLAVADPGSPSAWGDLARVCRHLQHVCEDRALPAAPLLAELHTDCLRHRDALAAARVED